LETELRAVKESQPSEFAKKMCMYNLTLLLGFVNKIDQAALEVLRIEMQALKEAQTKHQASM
jgi:hypothetical protein